MWRDIGLAVVGGLLAIAAAEAVVAAGKALPWNEVMYGGCVVGALVWALVTVKRG